MTNIDTIRKSLDDIKYTLKLPLELRGKFETSTRSAICQIDTLLEALVALSTIEVDELEQVKKERDDYKLWWEGATETHNKIRKLYDEQNMRLWKILKRPGCPEGLAQRMLKMPESDRDYFLSLAASTIDPDAIRRSCALYKDALRKIATVNRAPHSYMTAYAEIVDEAQAILGTEPAREES